MGTGVQSISTGVSGGVGSSVQRPDARLKVTGAYAFSSDLWLEGMAWGATLRSPYPYARIRRIDIGQALAQPGVFAVLTHEDVPGSKTYGMKVADQPVLAWDTVRYEGEPVAIVAADHPETARQALQRIVIDYEVLTPLTDPERALDPATPPLHAGGNIVRQVRIRHGDISAARERAEVIVRGEYETAMQDQAFLGPESGLAVPGKDGSVDLYVAAQWLHTDQKQIAACLGLPLDMCRLTLAGVGGAFGGREDLSMQIHAAMLALRIGRPIKMVYGRQESFVGHVHRHPARLRFEHGATQDGKITHVRAQLLLDGGAYTSTSAIVITNACYFAAGAYDVPHAEIDGFAVYTNNPPCGAMRGFGAVQACFGVESNMDKLASALGMDPVELRLRNAMHTGTVLPTGQRVEGPAPVAQLLRSVHAVPLPSGRRPDADQRRLPGGVANVTHGEGVRRGVGYAVGVKAICYSGGQDDFSTARVGLTSVQGTPVAVVHTAAAECGQGIVTVQAQVVRTELGVDRVVVHPADTAAGDAGSASASKLTWMSAGAVRGACRAVRARVLQLARDRSGLDGSLAWADGTIVDGATGKVLATLADVLGPDTIEETYEYHHRPTQPIDPETGQGDAHVAFAFAAHRAVVDVDTELGLARVVELALSQDVGKAMNPLAVEGQLDGGSAQGLGLALLEQMQVGNGKILNPSFTDYLIPTILDMPPVHKEILELPHPDSPYGLNGVGELPTLSATPAIVNALRAATGLPLPRAPVRPEDIASRREPAGSLRDHPDP